MIRTLSVLSLLAAVIVSTLLAGCASEMKPNALAGQQMQQVNDKQPRRL
ncbi:MAG TPA: hypothetical protein VHM90_21200 [Phycisphaerae bacterium]|jgi:outer membrane murein-binding lipoprotein Lpp|nr:hypothetical protein [Phycisphaerae bacterium]